MALPIYSTRLLDGDATPGAFNFIVPVGFVAVLRDFDAACTPGSISGASLGLSIATHEFYVVSVPPSPSPEAFNAQWRGRQVLQAFETATVSIGSGVLGWSLSGYLLKTP